MKKVPVISVKNLSVSYGETLAVSDFSFSIERGDFVGLTGPNGSGKSTLVKAILGLVEPSEGEIFLWGKPLKKFADFARIGYVPQWQNFLNKLLPTSVEEVVLTGMLGAKKFPRLIGKDDRKRVTKILADLKIKNLSSKLFSQLSGGQQQKVLLARALITNPELLILDEPSSALDQNARRNFFQMLKKLNEQEKVTIIIISHDTGYIGQYAKKLLYVDQKLIFFGLIDEFCPGKDKIACFEKKGEHLIWHQHE